MINNKILIINNYNNRYLNNLIKNNNNNNNINYNYRINNNKF